MIHSFKTEVACAIGVNHAIFLENLYRWVRRNAANDHNYHDGHYWSYNSTRALGDIFPYLSIGQIRKITNDLEADGYIVKGNYNKSTYDRTLWYSITDKGCELLGEKCIEIPPIPPAEEAPDITYEPPSITENADVKNSKSICKKQQMDLNDGANGFAAENEPIPSINPNIKPKKEPHICTPRAETETADTEVQEMRFAMFWEIYPRKVAKQDAVKAWRKIKPDAELFNKIYQAVQVQKNTYDWNKEAGKYVPHPATWLNGKRWEDEVRNNGGTATEKPCGDGTRSSAYTGRASGTGTPAGFKSD